MWSVIWTSKVSPGHVSLEYIYFQKVSFFLSLKFIQFSRSRSNLFAKCENTIQFFLFLRWLFEINQYIGLNFRQILEPENYPINVIFCSVIIQTWQLSIIAPINTTGIGFNGVNGNIVFFG